MTPTEHTRREFLGMAAAIAGGAAGLGNVLASIARAKAIEPAAGSSYHDAEHVVILMQENRSFDHAFGTLSGVRGFNDPRAITLPDGNPVWVQANERGERYVPFRLDINNTRITWMGSLPHSWPDQTDARNGGSYDRWLTAKRSRDKDYAKMPLTLGHYTRADIPFYYAFADAFTICDQYFCSSLTGTTPNRCYLWTGTIRERPTAAVPANVRNSEVDHDEMAGWPTFPERLLDHGISWKCYQNEISVWTGLENEEDDWLGNFTDNPLEFFRQYHVHLAPHRVAHVDRRLRELPGEIEAIARKLNSRELKPADKAEQQKQLVRLTRQLKELQAEQAAFKGKSVDQLADRERVMHRGAFSINNGDPNYRSLEQISYRDGDAERTMRVPKGDVLYQFRKDVESGQLPAVSWIVAGQKLSDHPSSAWYGAWYIAEVLNILTKNPEVWKKTVFILNYDENDGYFDHVPPFVAPRPGHPETGKVTKGIDASVEYVEYEQDRKRNPANESRGGPIGLGYRVPMIIASPWSRGGCVCSQVFDHTSVVQFLERLFSHRLGKKVEEPNISQWRRAVCGDLTSSFQAAAKPGGGVAFPPRDKFLESIHRAQYQPPPADFHPLTPAQIEVLRKEGAKSSLLPRQEPGVRPSCPLPYQLEANGALNADKTQFTIQLKALKQQFGERSAGAPFTVYAIGGEGKLTVRNYAVEAGETLEDSWPLADFAGGRYRLYVYGPNGFYREFRGGADDPRLNLGFGKTAGGVELVVMNTHDRDRFTIEVRDNAYGQPSQSHVIAPGRNLTITIATEKSARWYDFTLRVPGFAEFERCCAGRVETGEWGTTDPAMAAISG